jgi:predicted alpha/beta-fold hydrolase
MRVIDRIAVPALVITAEDDPFVPPAPFRGSSVMGNPNITLLLSRRGGHCGFLEPAIDGADGYWAERKIVGFAEAVTHR